MYNQDNARFNTPSFNAIPRTLEDTFKTKKREPSKLINEKVIDGVVYKEYAPSPEIRALRFNNGYPKTPYCMKEGMDRFRTAQRTNF
jgi:hypothetical protein